MIFTAEHWIKETMEQHKIKDKIMRQTVKVFKGLLELWNVVESQHWPTNDIGKIMVIGSARPQFANRFKEMKIGKTIRNRIP